MLRKAVVISVLSFAVLEFPARQRTGLGAESLGIERCIGIHTAGS